MKSKAFKELLAELDKLTPHQKKQIEEQLQHHTDIEAVITLIEKRLEAESSCPKCGSSEKSFDGDHQQDCSVIAAMDAKQLLMP